MKAGSQVARSQVSWWHVEQLTAVMVLSCHSNDVDVLSLLLECAFGGLPLHLPVRLSRRLQCFLERVAGELRAAWLYWTNHRDLVLLHSDVCDNGEGGLHNRGWLDSGSVWMRWNGRYEIEFTVSLEQGHFEQPVKLVAAGLLLDACQSQARQVVLCDLAEPLGRLVSA